MRDRLVLIGQSPNQETRDLRHRPGLAMTGSVGDRIARMAFPDLPPSRQRWLYLRNTERRNLLDRYAGKRGKGDAFDARAGTESARRMLPELHGRRVMFMGGNVSRCFGCLGNGLLRWHRDVFYPSVFPPQGNLACIMGWLLKERGYDAPNFTFWVSNVPHPSRVNRWWNDPRNEAQAAEFLRKSFAGEFDVEMRKTEAYGG